MTIWIPELESGARPRYLAIADALDDDIKGGDLKPGERLPTQRDLAYRLGVTVGTVSRAYAEAERRGLISGEVGRGTFVRGAAEAEDGLAPLFPLAPEGGEAAVVDLTINRPATGDQSQALAATLAALAGRGDLSPMLAYQPEAGAVAHRAAGAEWLRRWVPEAEADRVIVTGGGQHAIAATLAALTSPGDAVLTEALTWSGVKALAAMLHLKLEGIAIDDDGLVPSAFEAACLSRGARVLYCMPTLHNPTAAIMPSARRAQIVDIARRYDVAIVEDDVYGHLPSAAPPTLASLAPERTYYITSASKSLAPGLRIGFALVPEGMVARVAAGIRATTFMAPPVMAEVVASWIRDGTAERLVEWQRHEAAARQAIVAAALGETELHGHTCCHVWLELPAPWRGNDFVELARERGVAVTPADVFVAGRAPAPHAVRLALGSARSREELERGARILADLLAAHPRPRLTIV